MDYEEIVSNFINEELINLPLSVNDKLTFNTKKFNQRSEIDFIKKYIDDFLANQSTNRFFTIPGIRGVGKTTILFQLYEYLFKEKNLNPNQILYFSCEDLNNLVDCSIRQAVDIYLKSQFDTTLRLLDEKVFILVDESQYDKNWSISGKIIYDRSNNVFMVFTGSSALNLEYNADAARRMIKKTITPLNYKEHLKLRYNVDLSDLSKSLIEVIFKGKIDNAVKQEFEANTLLVNTFDYTSMDWNDYLKYGGFPNLVKKDTINKLVDVTRKVINTDMIEIMNFSNQNQTNANRILRYLALQHPGEVSQSKLSNFLQTSSLNVKNILDILEKTHLIFHTEPYSVSSKRITKSWKYYFATSSLRNALSTSIGNTSINSNEYEGVLLENLVASNLFNLSLREGYDYSLYYDANKKGNVDFLIQELFENPIPIEVGRGKKDKRQIKQAINRYDSSYGIVVSTKTKTIEKEDDIIYIPAKTFSFL